MSSVLGAFRGNVRDELGFMNVGARPDPTQTFYRANLPRLPLDSRSDILTTQVMTSVPIYLYEGDLVTSITFVSGVTAAGTPTNWWFALYSNAGVPALLGQTADQLTAAWAADTAKTLPLATAYRVTKSGVYWAAVMVKATTCPDLVGCVGAAPVLSGEINLAQTSGASLTTTAPATIATPTRQRAMPLAIAS